MPSVFEQGFEIFQDAQMLELFLNLPHTNDPGNNLLNYKYLDKQQVEDMNLQQMTTRKPDNYVMKTLIGHKVLCYVKMGNKPDTQ